MICERCGGNNSDSAARCAYCDQPLNNAQPGNKFFNNSSGTNGRPIININLFSNNTRQNNNTGYLPEGITAKNKWISILLCLFTVCGHKFYEGKIALGILYLFTGGLFGIGVVIDLLVLLLKPNPYYLKK